MKKKEVLIIFVLAILITWGSGFIYHPDPFCGRDVLDAACEWGWPLIFHRTGGFFEMNQWFWCNLLLDCFFWFVAIFAIWQVVKWVKGKVWKK